MRGVKKELNDNIKAIENGVKKLIQYKDNFQNILDNQKTIKTADLKKSFLEISDLLRTLDFDIAELKIRGAGLFRPYTPSPNQASASRRNGKLGGRPPKEITEARKRLSELRERGVYFWKSDVSPQELQEVEALENKIEEWEKTQREKRLDNSPNLS